MKPAAKKPDPKPAPPAIYPNTLAELIEMFVKLRKGAEGGSEHQRKRKH